MNTGPTDRRRFLRRSTLAGGALLGGSALASLPGETRARPAPPRTPAEARIRELGLTLPPPMRQTPTIRPAVRVDNLVYVSGHGPRREDGGSVTGKVGADLSADEGYEAARLTGLAVLATLQNELESLDDVVRVVKILGMVNAVPDFTQQPRVINGFSELMIEVFGDNGRAARSAVGVGSLPGNWAVEVEAIFEVAD